MAALRRLEAERARLIEERRAWPPPEPGSSPGAERERGEASGAPQRPASGRGGVAALAPVLGERCSSPLSVCRSTSSAPGFSQLDSFVGGTHHDGTAGRVCSWPVTTSRGARSLLRRRGRCLSHARVPGSDPWRPWHRPWGRPPHESRFGRPAAPCGHRGRLRSAPMVRAPGREPLAPAPLIRQPGRQGRATRLAKRAVAKAKPPASRVGPDTLRRARLRGGTRGGTPTRSCRGCT